MINNRGINWKVIDGNFDGTLKEETKTPTKTSRGSFSGPYS